MPWFQEIELARRARLRAVDRATPAPRLDYFEGILNRDPAELEASFADAPLVHDPRHGRVEGSDAFREYVTATREWLQAQPGLDPVAVTATGGRFVEEVSVRLAGDHPELPVAVAADLADDGRIAEVRVYFSLWPLTGGHEVRPPLLERDPEIELEGSPAAYQRALAAGDAEGIVASFEPDGVAREPSGGPYTYRASELGRIYGLMFANGGGIPLEWCTVTDDGTACAIEYNCTRWGKDEIPPQAGIAVYVRGKTGLLAAARIYDDVDPPAASDSSQPAA